MLGLSFAVLSTLLTFVLCYPSTPPGGSQHNPNSRDDNPAYTMFRNFASSFPPYANPMNYIPPQAFPPGGYPGAYPGQFPFGPVNPYGGGGGGGQPYGIPPGAYVGQPGQSINGMGYGGPYTPNGYGQPNPGYGNAGSQNPPGTVPVVNTRLAGNGAGGTSVVKTDDGRFVEVNAQTSPDGKPVFRSQSFQGPNSYGTAYAYSSG